MDPGVRTGREESQGLDVYDPLFTPSGSLASPYPDLDPRLFCVPGRRLGAYSPGSERPVWGLSRTGTLPNVRGPLCGPRQGLRG